MAQAVLKAQSPNTQSPNARRDNEVFLCLALVGAAPKKPGKPVPPRAGGSGIANPESADVLQTNTALQRLQLLRQLTGWLKIWWVWMQVLVQAYPRHLCARRWQRQLLPTTKRCLLRPAHPRHLCARRWQRQLLAVQILTCSVTTKRCLLQPAHPRHLCARRQWQRQLLPTTKQCLLQPACLPLPQPALAQLPSQWLSVNLLRKQLSVSENPAELFDEIPLPSAPSQPTGAAAAEMAPDSPTIIYRAVFGMRDASDPSGMLRMVYYKVTHLVLLFLIASSALWLTVCQPWRICRSMPSLMPLLLSLPRGTHLYVCLHYALSV